jgi:hypothetical protein
MTDQTADGGGQGGRLRPEQDRQLAADLFNRTWELLELETRTAEQDREMLCCAMGSRLHWERVGTDENLTVADWLVGQVASRLGHASLAVDFAVAALDRAEGARLKPWVLASALEGVARAYAADGEGAKRDEFVARAVAALDIIDEEEDRELIESQIATVPR